MTTKILWESRLFHFALGVAAGAAVMLHVMTRQIEHHNVQAVAALQRVTAQYSQVAEGWQVRAESCERRLQGVTARVTQLEMASQVLDPGGWVTLLYEPSTDSQDVRQLVWSGLNALQPGLGTLAAKAAPPGASLRVRWVLPGTIKPIVAPSGAHSVWTHP
jgi:hypothetical protein